MLPFHLKEKNKKVYIAKRKLPKVRQLKLDKQYEPPMGLVQGKTPDSYGEWIVSLAFDYWEIEYLFHYEIMGGKRVRGGQVIDFFVLTDPLPTPTYYNGEYWHEGKFGIDDAYKIAQVKKYLKGQILEPVIIWEKKEAVYNLERAKIVVKEKFL